jgi:hypothetical protein
LNKGLSLAEIGRRVHLHEATVGYWVQKHGLEAVNRSKHVSKGAIPEDELEALVETGASIAEIAEVVGRSRRLCGIGWQSTACGRGEASADARETGLVRLVNRGLRV